MANGEATKGWSTPPSAAGGARAAKTRRLHPLSLTVLLVGAAVSVGLWISSRVSYNHTETHLTTLETELTASSLGIAQVDLERRLGAALNRAYGTRDPAAAFRQTISSSMLPTGPFANAGLQVVRDNRVEVLVTLGKSLTDLHDETASALFAKAARSSQLMTTHVVAHGEQRLAYLLSLPSAHGTLVAAASQPLPADRKVSVPANSPDANLWVAIYFGRRTTPANLLETNAPSTPLRGTVASSEVPFGDHVLTLVTSPRTSLDGGWSKTVPWGILVVGVLFTLAIAAMTERLVRRRQIAETLAIENTALYDEQRAIAGTLQRAILPKQLPQIAGVEFATRYLPGALGVEVGGDWYSAIRSGENSFAFVVGDVAGKGIDAAAAMASLRYTIRTLAALGHRPGEILELTARELRSTGEERFATALIGSFDLVTRELSLASAGHLPPLLVSRDRTCFLDVPVGPPLGVAPVTYECSTIRLFDSVSVLGYTDGLVERRGESLDAGLERLRRAALASTASPEELITRILAELGAATAEDDVAILAVRLPALGIGVVEG